MTEYDMKCFVWLCAESPLTGKDFRLHTNKQVLVQIIMKVSVWSQIPTCVDGGLSSAHLWVPPYFYFPAEQTLWTECSEVSQTAARRGVIVDFEQFHKLCQSALSDMSVHHVFRVSHRTDWLYCEWQRQSTFDKHCFHSWFIEQEERQHSEAVCEKLIVDYYESSIMTCWTTFSNNDLKYLTFTPSSPFFLGLCQIIVLLHAPVMAKLSDRWSTSPAPCAWELI